MLQYFVVLAQELNFGRAAARLLVAQPSLSYAIKKLEKELGVALLERDNRRVSLTEAGRAVLVEAEKTLKQAAHLVEVAEQFQAGIVGTMPIGFEATGAGQVGAMAQASFTKKYPNVRLVPRRFDWGEEADALREGTIDVAYLWLPANTAELELEVIAREVRMVGLPLSHPLTAKSSVRIMDIKDEPLMWTKKAPKAWVDWWAVNPRPDGSEPRWGPTNENVEEMLEQVASGRAVCIVPGSMATYYARPDLVWRPIEDIAPLEIAIGWRRGQLAPLVEAFVTVLREVTGQR